MAWNRPCKLVKCEGSRPSSERVVWVEGDPGDVVSSSPAVRLAGMVSKLGVTCCAVGAAMPCCCPPQVPSMRSSCRVSVGKQDGVTAHGLESSTWSDPGDDDDVANDGLSLR